MEYSLAKELKEAGFPQGNIWLERPNSFFDDDGDSSDWYTGNDPTYNPTLSELIEACGEEFGGLYKYDGEDGWVAQPKSFEKVGYTGKTPEEAVARLWLALQKEA